jgi:hypothetical protein
MNVIVYTETTKFVARMLRNVDLEQVTFLLDWRFLQL